MGLRERKKQQTRQLIADSAARLFAEHGFDQVTVAEVARRADVSEATVFNYFPTKEDLFYSRLETFGTRLVDAVAARGSDESVLAAFRRFILEAEGPLRMIDDGDAATLEQLRTVSRVISASPALQAREAQALAHITDALADQLAAEAGGGADDIDAHVVAAALMGVHRTLIEYVRSRVLATGEPTRLAADVRERAERAFALLEQGLHGYVPKPPAHPG